MLITSLLIWIVDWIAQIPLALPLNLKQNTNTEFTRVTYWCNISEQSPRVCRPTSEKKKLERRTL